MTSYEIKQLPSSQQAVTRASYLYYRALLGRASASTRQRLYGDWQSEIRRCWLDVKRPV